MKARIHSILFLPKNDNSLLNWSSSNKDQEYIFTTYACKICNFFDIVLILHVILSELSVSQILIFDRLAMKILGTMILVETLIISTVI